MRCAQRVRLLNGIGIHISGLPPRSHCAKPLPSSSHVAVPSRTSKTRHIIRSLATSTRRSRYSSITHVFETERKAEPATLPRPSSNSRLSSAALVAPKPAHERNINQISSTNYAITLRTTPYTNFAIETIRKRHTPHLLTRFETLRLFRALPGAHLRRIFGDLHDLARSTTAAQICLDPLPAALEPGAGLTLAGPGIETAKRVQQELRRRWVDFVGAADFLPSRQLARVELQCSGEGGDETEQVAYRETLRMLEGASARVDEWALGLTLYRQDSDGWTLVREYRFRDPQMKAYSQATGRKGEDLLVREAQETVTGDQRPEKRLIRYHGV